MFRVTRSFVFTRVLSLFLASLCLVLASPAGTDSFAGEPARKHYRQHFGHKDAGAGRHDQHVGGMRKHRENSQHWRKPGSIEPHHSSGVLLASGRRTHATRHTDASRRHGGFAKFSDRHYREPRHARHQRKHRSGQIVVINVNQSINDADDDAGGQGAMLESAMLERECASGQYCSIRLGADANSPKIITLNSGSSLSGAMAGAQSPDPATPDLIKAGPQVIELDEAELMQRYGDK